MSKKIKPAAPSIEEIISRFTQWIRSEKPSGKIKYEYDPANSDEKAELLFTAGAYIKMKYLIAAYDSEVAWHGVVRRPDPNASTFVVEDILVYPQEVTGATVNTDQTAYQSWLCDLDDDTFNNLRFQGHSHVNMGVSPSPTDLEHQSAILEQVEDDMFYIFVIWNKKGDRTIKIYDKVRNTLYETADVDVKILTDDDDAGFYKLMSDAVDMIKKKQYSYNSGAYSGTGSYTNVYGSGYYSGKSSKNDAESHITKSSGASAVKAAADKVSPKESYDRGKKGKRADGVTRSDYGWGSDYEYDMFGD